jgi:hypothetical protein
MQKKLLIISDLFYTMPMSDTTTSPKFRTYKTKHLILSVYRTGMTYLHISVKNSQWSRYKFQAITREQAAKALLDIRAAKRAAKKAEVEALVSVASYL